MEAILDGKLVQLPDPRVEPDRVLVRVAYSTNLPPFRPFASVRFRRAFRTWQPQVNVAMRRDGIAMLLGKSLHAIRRERDELVGRCASFCGEVISTPDPLRLPLGALVAGVSMSCPADTEYVVARPDFVFPLSSAIDRRTAAAVLYGGMSLYAVRKAIAKSVRGIAIAGSGVRAHLAAQCLRRGSKCDSGDADVWIEADTPASRRRTRAELVIGIGGTLEGLKRAWPNALQHEALSIADLAADIGRINDLYFRDGPGDWPDWHVPDVFSGFLELVADGAIAPVSFAESFRPSKPDVTLVEFARPSTGINPTYRPARVTLRERDSASKRISVIGAGRHSMGTVVRHLARHSGIGLLGLCDRRPEALHLAGKSLPFRYLTTDLQELIADPQADLIVVAPYQESHARYAIEALRAGKHCFVEKPPALTLEELAQLETATRQAPGRLWVGYNRRFAPATERLMQALAEEQGPVTITMLVRPPTIPKAKLWTLWPSNGGSRIINNLCHQADLALHIVGNVRPQSVQTTASIVGRSDFNLNLSVNFEDGSIASIVFTNRGRDDNVVARDELVSVMRGGTTATIDGFTRLRIARKGRERTAWSGPLDRGHRNQMAVIARALLTNEEQPFLPEVAFKSARIYLGAARSLASGAPVDLTEAAA